MAVIQALQSNGKLHIARSDYVLDLKVFECGREVQLLDDLGILHETARRPIEPNFFSIHKHSSLPRHDTAFLKLKFHTAPSLQQSLLGPHSLHQCRPGNGNELCTSASITYIAQAPHN